MIDVLSIGPENEHERYNWIQDTLAAGMAVRFTNRINGIQKWVTVFNIDDMGDLKAQYSTGATRYVCPVALEYDVAAVPMSDVPVDEYTCCQCGTKGLSKWCGKCEQPRGSAIGRGT